MKFFCYFVFLTLISFSSAYADLEYTPADSNTVPKIRVYGTIGNTDSQYFNKFVESARQSAKSIGLTSTEGIPLLIELDSMGGSVQAAIAIGRKIRSINPWSVTVQHNSYCVSACVLILAGGTTRLVDGVVGIHRPYVGDDQAYSATSQKQTYSAIEKNIKEYLTSVNVPTSLYDVMFRIPPEKVRYLSDKELQDYNLSEDDPYYKEAADARIAKHFGVTKSVYQNGKSRCVTGSSNESTIKECLLRGVR